MKRRRIPFDAFEQYVAMGPDRSYRELAEKFDVSKRAVSQLAIRENWAERLAKVEEEARERTESKLAETLSEMRARHLKTCRVMHGRAVEALKNFPLNTAMEAVRAAEAAIKLERLIAGEPGERSEVSLEEVTRREIRTLLVRDEADAEDDW